MKKIFISSDHAGYKLKDYIKSNIPKKNKIFDLGPFDTKSVDYPVYAHKLAKNVKKSKKNFGIWFADQEQEWISLQTNTKI